MTAKHDRWIIVLLILLIVIGLTAVYSSTSVISPDLIEKYKKKGIEISQFFYLKRQVFTLFLGVFALLAAYKMPAHIIKKLSIPLLIFSMVCLLLVFSPLGVSAGGARRWLRLWPSVFQPSEMVKLCMVIFLAWYLSCSSYNKDKFSSFIIPVGVMGLFQIVFLKQPDFGAVMSLGMLTLFMLFLSGTRLRYIFSLGIIAVPVVIKLITEPYRWKRVVTFLDPWKDAQGSGFQLVQSFIALGSGGAAGVGLGESRQKLAFLPEVHTDFIFSLIGEELGFAGAAVVVFLFLLLFLRGMRVANRASDNFSYFLAFGISIMIAVQAIINFSVVTGMVPTKGLPLPFVSYGGSSLIINMTAIGLLLSVSRGQKLHLSETVIASANEDVESVVAISRMDEAKSRARQQMAMTDAKSRKISSRKRHSWQYGPPSVRPRIIWKADASHTSRRNNIGDKK
ncbi:MAG: putative lipid II flippase FtsW [Dissulfurispiraceae bacterium]|nr:putative lipid II flippase FtsW [Dissulfurispiraceae bacterium]